VSLVRKDDRLRLFENGGRAKGDIWAQNGKCNRRENISSIMRSSMNYSLHHVLPG